MWSKIHKDGPGFAEAVRSRGKNNVQHLIASAISSHQFIDGEFDPGSGRTLAACLRNASRAGVAIL